MAGIDGLSTGIYKADQNGSISSKTKVYDKPITQNEIPKLKLSPGTYHVIGNNGKTLFIFTIKDVGIQKNTEKAAIAKDEDTTSRTLSKPEMDQHMRNIEHYFSIKSEGNKIYFSLNDADKKIPTDAMINNMIAYLLLNPNEKHIIGGKEVTNKQLADLLIKHKETLNKQGLPDKDIAATHGKEWEDTNKTNEKGHPIKARVYGKSDVVIVYVIGDDGSVGIEDTNKKEHIPNDIKENKINSEYREAVRTYRDAAIATIKKEALADERNGQYSINERAEILNGKAKMTILDNDVLWEPETNTFGYTSIVKIEFNNPKSVKYKIVSIRPTATEEFKANGLEHHKGTVNVKFDNKKNTGLHIVQTSNLLSEKEYNNFIRKRDASTTIIKTAENCKISINEVNVGKPQRSTSDYKAEIDVNKTIGGKVKENAYEVAEEANKQLSKNNDLQQVYHSTKNPGKYSKIDPTAKWPEAKRKNYASWKKIHEAELTRLTREEDIIKKYEEYLQKR